jgi:tRNA-dihydrouridine synthase B
MTYTELISAKGYLLQSPGVKKLVYFTPMERPIALQFYGHEPSIMEEAAHKAKEELKPDTIDINMGCPARKVVKRGGGAALLKNRGRALKILEATLKEAQGIPVTVKTRLAWSWQGIHALPHFMKSLEERGAAMVTLHARVGTESFQGEAHWDYLRVAKENLASIPLIGNGDVKGPSQARYILQDLGCQGVMIGRGSLGKPWIFERIKMELRGKSWTEPPPHKILETILEQAQMEIALKGEKRGIQEMRKFIVWYTKGFPGISKLRQTLPQVMCLDSLVKMMVTFFKGRTPKGSRSYAI